MSASELVLVSDSSRAAVPGHEDVPLAVPGSAESFPAAVGEPPARALGRRVGEGPCLTRPRDEAAVPVVPGVVRAAGPGRREFGLTAAHGPPGARSGSPPTRPPPAREAVVGPVTVQETAGFGAALNARGSVPGVPGGRPASSRGACLRAEEGVP